VLIPHVGNERATRLKKGSGLSV